MQVIFQAVVKISHGELDCDLPSDEILGSISAVLFLSLILLVVGFKFRAEIKIILYIKLGLRPFDKTDDNICRKVKNGWFNWYHYFWNTVNISLILLIYFHFMNFALHRLMMLSLAHLNTFLTDL